MPRRFVFRQVDQRDLEQFLQDWEVRSKNYLPAQPCHQTSHRNIVERRGGQIFALPYGGVVNDYVAFYLSPVTAFTYAIHRGSVSVHSPSGEDLGMSDLSQRAFLVANVATLFARYRQVCFSNYALNSNAPSPTVLADREQFATHINWAQFDEIPMVAQIPEIKYEGVCKYFNSNPTPGPRHHRSTERMAEFLVKDAVSMSDISAIVLPTVEAQRRIKRVADQAGYEGLVLSKPGCFIS